MRTLFTSFFALLANATHWELARQLRYLKAENRILRDRLPERIKVTAAERRRLIRFGKPLGTAIRELITIVSPRTFSRWLLDEKRKRGSGKPGRKPLVALKELVVQIAGETGYGYTRVMGEMKKLTRRKFSRQFVVNTMREHDFDPGPKRGEHSWDEFLKMHAQTLWQCDFFGKKVLTLSGVREFFVLAFIHVGTRRVYATPATAHPTEEWCRARAIDFVHHATCAGLKAEFVFHDRDSKFGKAFDEELARHGIKGDRVAYRAPNLNAFIERWIQSIEVEALDHFIVFGERHLSHIVAEYVRHYLVQRPHQSLGNAPLTELPAPPDDVPRPSDVRCERSLGGLIKHYHRAAA